jgi:dienelactone hydrolase
MELTTDISDFDRRTISMLGKTKPVLVTGTSGPAVIVIHEIYGFTQTLARFCRWVREAGFRVYAPILFGEPDASNPEKPSNMRILSLCISREFTILKANRSSPVTDWRTRAACASGVRRPGCRRHRHVCHRRFCALHGA